jgi:alkylated DNA repair dioxygenase AlkB
MKNTMMRTTFRSARRSIEILDMNDQLALFGAGPALPEGFVYERELISRAHEAQLLENFKELPFKEFEFHGYLGKRPVVSFGWRYNFDESTLQKSNDIPEFLLSIREAAATFAGLKPADLQHVLVTEYSAGAAIGWHRDKAVFGDVIGISLLSSCVFRLRRKTGSKWDRASVIAEPRSAYLMRGPSRTVWEHSIPPVDALRYSITFRNLLE